MPFTLCKEGILEKFERFEGEVAERYGEAVSSISPILYYHAIRDLKKFGVKGRHLEAGCGPGILALRGIIILKQNTRTLSLKLQLSS